MKEKIRIGAKKETWRPSPLAGQVFLVTTVNEDGSSNVAPKSWVSMVAFNPPLVALGCNLSHWTAQNILRTDEFVLNVPGAELAQVVWKASSLPHPRPVECLGLTSIPGTTVKPPRIEECGAHLECKRISHLTYGNEIVFIGQILEASVDKDILESTDPYHLLRPFFFLENKTFGVIDRSNSI